MPCRPLADGPLCPGCTGGHPLRCESQNETEHSGSGHRARTGTGRKLLPTLYLLHGHGGNAFTWPTIKPELPQMADRDGIIVVCPDGEASWYWDSPLRPESQFETFVARELDRLDRLPLSHHQRPQGTGHHRTQHGRTRKYVAVLPSQGSVRSSRKYQRRCRHPSVPPKLGNEQPPG